jgi:heparosan-N-sulfate-glucuronate 5-epimerase
MRGDWRPKLCGAYSGEATAGVTRGAGGRAAGPGTGCPGSAIASVLMTGAGFFSTSFGEPPGQLVDPGRVRGYYIDMRVKASAPGEPPLHDLHVVTAQWGLGAFEHWLHTGEEGWLEAAGRAGERLIAAQLPDGGLPHLAPYPHTYRLEPPWLSAMAQGQAASLLVRLHAERGDERLADAARRALRPFGIPSDAGGVRAELDGGPYYEEYPTEPASYVLNGGIFALWGLLDTGLALGDADASGMFGEGVDVLAGSLTRWDLGWWSRYDLFPHRALNVASPAYHELHIHQLRALQAVAPRPQIAACLERFEAYGSSGLRRARALTRKAIFRLAVPRRRRAT